MADFDRAIRNRRVATAADAVTCDFGVAGGTDRRPGGKPGSRRGGGIDAAGKLVLPGGVDSQCHFDQPMSDGSRMAGDFRSGTTAAACGGTTTVIPFACQMKGGSLGEAIDDDHRGRGQGPIDYAFHLIISDPTEQVMGQELPALIRDGYTSFKIYMTYDDLKLSDREMLAVFALARREDALTMVHAENADCIGWRPPARRRPATTPRRGRRWSSGRPPTGPSPWPNCGTCQSSSSTYRAGRRRRRSGRPGAPSWSNTGPSSERKAGVVSCPASCRGRPVRGIPGRYPELPAAGGLILWKFGDHMIFSTRRSPFSPSPKPQGPNLLGQ